MPAPNRFFIIGLPRSGSTYLMDLLNSHPGILCAGELFNPSEAIGYDGNDKPTSGFTGRETDPEKLVYRNREPVAWLRQYFDGHHDSDLQAIGVKYMISQNVGLLQNLHLFPGARIVYLYRPNKLAQVSSFMRAIQTKVWAQRDVTVDKPVRARMKLNLQRFFQLWHEFDTYDMLFQSYLETLPQNILRIEYADMFAPGFAARLQDFLGVTPETGLQAGLVKQNAPVIGDRFVNSAEVERLLTRLDRADWLGPEITPELVPEVTPGIPPEVMSDSPESAGNATADAPHIQATA